MPPPARERGRSGSCRGRNGLRPIGPVKTGMGPFSLASYRDVSGPPAGAVGSLGRAGGRPVGNGRGPPPRMDSLDALGPYECKYGNIFFEEIRRLDSIGFIKPPQTNKDKGFNTTGRCIFCLPVVTSEVPCPASRASPPPPPCPTWGSGGASDPPASRTPPSRPSAAPASPPWRSPGGSPSTGGMGREVSSSPERCRLRRESQSGGPARSSMARLPPCV